MLSDSLKTYFALPSMLLTLDMFGAGIPAFNVMGKDQVRTHCGGCLSLVILSVTFLFATLKLQHLLSRHNPSVNTFVEKDAFDDSDIWLGTDNEDFMLAVTVVDYATGEVKDDPKFVKWYGQYINVTDGQ